MSTKFAKMVDIFLSGLCLYLMAESTSQSLDIQAEAVAQISQGLSQISKVT